MAHAFLAAGADVVVAAVRPVADDVAARIVRGLYASLDPARDFAEALRRSELAEREAHPGSDWCAFRVLRP
jgi:hypothetical protein